MRKKPAQAQGGCMATGGTVAHAVPTRSAKKYPIANPVRVPDERSYRRKEPRKQSTMNANLLAAQP
eukprot:202657-Pleurochrysis_carterae.AAC.1